MIRPVGTFVLSVVAVVVSAHVQRPEPNPIPKGTNALFGRVLEIGTDSPVGGAIVTLAGSFDASGKPTGRYPGSMASQPSIPRNVMTMPDGHFVFRDLPAGKYSIAVAAIGYVRNDYPPHLIDLRDSEKPASMALRLWRHGAISGTVTDERGEPVVGIPVSALRRATVGGAVTLTRRVDDVLTDDRGRYRLAQLPPGTYVVGALWTPISIPTSVLAALEAASANPFVLNPIRLELIRGGIRGDVPYAGLRRGDFVLQQTGAPASFAPDGRLLAYSSTLHPGTSFATAATAIVLGSGDTREGLDLSLRFSPTVRVSGTVMGPDGPVKNLVLKLLPPNGADLTDAESAGVPQAATDANGAFAFLGVPPGSYTLKAALWTDDASAPESGRGHCLWAVMPVDVQDRDISDIALAMRPGIRVSGRVQFKDAQGATPWTGGRTPVSLRPLGAGSWRTLQALVRPDGTFSTPGDPAGRYMLNAYAPPGWTFHGVFRNGRRVPDDVIELETSDLTDIELVYSRKSTRIYGSIADAAGTPDNQTDVVVFPADTVLWREGIMNNRRVKSVHATSEARFDVDLPPGDYYVAAVSAHLMVDWQDPAFLERLVRGATTITLADGDERSLTLKTLSPGGR